MIDVTLSPDEVLSEVRDFGFQEYAKTITYLISNKNTKTPITIAIHGNWGSGKSCLMNTILNIITDKKCFNSYFKNKNEKFDMKKTKIIWFNAWEFEKEIAISMALLSHVVYELKRNLSSNFLRGEIKKVGKIIGKIVIDLALKNIGGLTLSEIKKHFEEYQDDVELISSLRKSFKKAIDEFIEDNDQGYEQIIIFIDDLDRCSIENSKDIIDTIHLFLSTENCIFILGVDIEKLQKSLRWKYKEMLEFDAKEYIDKIVQLRFELPPISLKDMKKYIEDIKPKSFKKEYIDIILEGIPLNPRAIKLFMNTIKFQLVLSEYRGSKINEALLIEWMVLKNTFPKFTIEIENNPEVLKEYHNDILTNEFKKINDDERLNFFNNNPELKEVFLDNSKLLNILNVNKKKFTTRDVESVIYQTKSTPSSLKEISEKNVEKIGMSNAKTMHVYKILKEIFENRPFYIKEAAKAFFDKNIDISPQTLRKYLAIMEVQGLLEKTTEKHPYIYYYII